MIGVLDILAVIAILANRLRLRAPRLSTVDSDGPGGDASVERARAIVQWAEGTALDWDRHVRPVLARELSELTRGRRGSGERMLGPELWPLVDPEHPFEHPDEPGPGRAGLTRVLDRLERL